jgi:NADP-dependent aldehyde dehydrogenase
VTADADPGWNPYTGEPVGPPVPHTAPGEVDRTCRAAAAAVGPLSAIPLASRAALLRAVASALESERDGIVALADAETGLGRTRLGGELTRTTVQLEMFAGVVEDGSFLEAIVDLPDPTARPTPRPDLRRMLVPVGPVAVYAAGNFPLAFSVAGGDTASALAAGCPVVVKVHPGHPGLSVRCGQTVAAALSGAGAPEGTFALVHGVEAGRELVTHPAIAAAAFTGSLAGGRSLHDLAAARPAPIPFYGELGSLNPTVVTPGAAAARGTAIAHGFVGSFTLGAGQFCTKPGLLFLPRGHRLEQPLADAVAEAPIGPLLNARIRDAFVHAAAEMAAAPGVETVAAAAAVDRPGFWAAPLLLRVAVTDLLGQADRLLAECFGPAALVVEYGSVEELTAALTAVPGSLAGTLHAEPDSEPELTRTVLDHLAHTCGRVILDGWPTGVAVSWAQHHGGPWPATTASLHTSVGVTAARRFLRPVAYQNVPDPLLPAPLRDANPLGIPRRVNGTLTTNPVPADNLE